MILLMIFMNSACLGQIQWNFTINKIADKAYQVHMRADISEPWHIYAQSSPKGGPLPTKITFNINPLVVIDGKTKEIGQMKREFNSVFNEYVFSYAETVDFVQAIRLKANIKTSLSGVIDFMICTESQCMPPAKQKFSIDIN